MPEAIIALASYISITLTAAEASAILFVATLALNVGLSLLLRPSARRESKPDNTRNFRYERYPRIFVTGRAIIAGGILFQEAKRSPSTLYSVIAHCQGEVVFERTLFDDTQVRLGGDYGEVYSLAHGWTPAHVTYPRRMLEYGGYISAIRVIEYTGTDSQTADETLLETFANAWTSDHRLRGIAYSVCEFGIIDSDFFQQIYRGGSPPDVKKQVLSQRVFGVTGNADPSDMSTWSASSNAADAIASLLLRPRTEGGFGIDPDLVDIDNTFAAFAAVCDRDVVRASDGVTRKLWSVDGSWSANDDPREVLERMQRCCMAQLFETSDGKIGIRGGRWEEPTVHFGDSEIIALEMERGPDVFTAVTTIKPVWMSLDHGGMSQEGTAVEDAGLVAAAGGETITENYNADMCVSHDQARHCAAIDLRRKNCAWRGKITTTLLGLPAWDHATISLSISALELMSEPFRVVDRELRGDLIEWTVESTRESDWDAPEWAAPPELPKTTDAKPGAPNIRHPGFCLAFTGNDGAGGTFIRFQAAPPPGRPDAMVAITYWLNGAASVTETSTPAGKFAALSGTYTRVILPVGETQLRVDGFTAGQTWKFWAETYTPDGNVSEWNSSYDEAGDSHTPGSIVTSTTATTPFPGSIDFVTSTLPPDGGGGSVIVEARASSDQDVVAAEFYYVMDSAVFSTANPIGAPVVASPYLYCYAEESPNFYISGHYYTIFVRFQRADTSYMTPISTTVDFTA